MVDVKKFLEEQREAQEVQQAATGDILSKLHMAKAKSNAAISRKESQIQGHKKDIEEINAAICQIGGHSWTPWIEYECRYVDRSWYYSRTCECCGKTQSPERGTPTDYITERKWKEMQKNKLQAELVPKVKRKSKKGLTVSS